MHHLLPVTSPFLCTLAGTFRVCVGRKTGGVGRERSPQGRGNTPHFTHPPPLGFTGSLFLNNVLLLSYLPHHTHTHLTQQAKNPLSSTSKSLGLKIFASFRPYPNLVMDWNFTVYGGCLKSCPFLKRNQNAAMS